MINAQNQRTEFVYDALNRLIKTQHADGSFSQTEWRNDGLKAAEIDETGRRVDYRYDNAGRLIEVITTDGQTP